MAISGICDHEACTGCKVCCEVCPKQCISFEEDALGFWYPQIDEKLCCECNRCRNTCPMNHEIEKSIGKYYMGWHKDHEILMKSSSGGAFSALANIVIDHGGIVIGAELDQDTRIVRHIAVETEQDVARLRFSKYYQSDTASIYATVRQYLKNNRYVLFSGTACQVAALKSYLGNTRFSENLLTVDVLCHGVTSKKIVEKYIASKEKHGNVVKEIYFRVKSSNHKWENGGGTNVNLLYSNGCTIIEDRMKDSFFVGFNHDQILRESCYQCRFTGESRPSDFTLADYWGVSVSEAGIDALKNGVSAITANTEKAIRLIPALTEKMTIKETQKKNIIANNRSFRAPAPRPIERSVFYNKFAESDYEQLIHELNRSYYIRIKAKRILQLVIGDKAYGAIKTLIKGRFEKYHRF